MTSIRGKLINLMYRCTIKDQKNTIRDYTKEREFQESTPKKDIKDVNVAKIKLGSIDAERITKSGNKEVILYIHGGGFTTGSAKARRAFCQMVANEYGWNCIVIDYPLSPENKWPTHLDSCYEAYERLLGKNYHSIVLMGESAGGTLALSLALKLKDKDIPQPQAIVAYSAYTNQIPNGFKSHTANQTTDYMLRGNLFLPTQYEAVFGEEMPDEKLLSNYLVSPYFGDYSKLPPIFLAASDTEVLYDDSRCLYNKLKDEKHICQLDIQKGVCHAYPMFSFLPESKATLEKAFLFLEKYV